VTVRAAAFGVVLLAVAVGGLLTVAAWRTRSESSWAISTSRIDPSLPPTIEAPPVEPAPAAVTRQALAIARADELFRVLTRGERPRLAHASEWWSIDRERLGAWLTFALRTPIAVDAVLPIADIPPDAPTKGTCETPYRQTWLREDSHGTTELAVLADLRRSKVVQISTNATRGRRSWVEGKPHPSCAAIPSG
jgi:hypothetical protein